MSYDDILTVEDDEARRRAIEEMMRLDRPRYFRDEAVQQEYRDILERQASAKPMRPTSSMQANSENNESASAALPPEGTTIVQAPAHSAPPPPTSPQAQAPATRTSRSDAQMSALVDREFKGTPLQGQWGTIKAAAQKRNFDPILMLGIVAHETGRGKNVRFNNPGGIMDPATKWKTKKKFNTLSEGIDFTAATIAKNYRRAGGDLGKLAKIYAPPGAANDPTNLNQHWISGVQGHMRVFSGP